MLVLGVSSTVDVQASAWDAAPGRDPGRKWMSALDLDLRREISPTPQAAAAFCAWPGKEIFADAFVEREQG